VVLKWAFSISPRVSQSLSRKRAEISAVTAYPKISRRGKFGDKSWRRGEAGEAVELNKMMAVGEEDNLHIQPPAPGVA